MLSTYIKNTRSTEIVINITDFYKKYIIIIYLIFLFFIKTEMEIFLISNIHTKYKVARLYQTKLKILKT